MLDPGCLPLHSKSMKFNTFLFEIGDNWLDYASLIGRLFIGVCFVVHGLGKLGVVGTGNMQKFEAWLTSLQVPAPRVQARLAMFFELVGGASMALGIFTRIGCLMCMAVMIIASIVGHKGGGYLITNEPPGNEYTVNLAALSLVFFLMGPGRYSLDAYFFG